MTSENKKKIFCRIDQWKTKIFHFSFKNKTKILMQVVSGGHDNHFCQDGHFKGLNAPLWPQIELQIKV